MGWRVRSSLPALGDRKQELSIGLRRLEPVDEQLEGRSRFECEQNPAQLPNLGKLLALELDAGVTLLLSGAVRGLHEDDIEAIRVAAAPLVKLLNRRHILSGN